jgi:probable H4MPT-linked C1 transfer pathway protein
VLLDIGSTTTDIIPLLNGVPVPHGLTDGERLQSGELVYSGVRRTPVCAIAHSVPFRDGYCPLAAELFATTLDVYLLLDCIAEDAGDFNTANGKPATKAAAHDRLARALCCDRTEVSIAEAESIARFLADVQKQRLHGALERVRTQLNADCESVLISGSGAFLAEELVRNHPQLQHARCTSVVEIFGGRAADAACALAVARLALERLAHDPT